MKNKFMVDAMFTLEVAVVFPLVFMVIIANILFSFYMHDRAKMQACAYNAVVEDAYRNAGIKTVADEEKGKMAVLSVTDISSDTEGDSVIYSGKVRSGRDVFGVFGDGTVSESKSFVPKMKLKYLYICKEALELVNERGKK